MQVQHVLADSLFLNTRADVDEMEVCRAPPTVSEEDLSQQSVQAVAALHKSMVTLRTELIKKNRRIQELEEKEINNNSNTSRRDDSNKVEEGRHEKHVEQRPFEDMFVLQVLKEDVDQILRYEDSLARAKQQEQERHEREEQRKRRQYEAAKDRIEQDPVEAFVALSEGEDEDESGDFTDSLAKVSRTEEEAGKKRSSNSFRLIPNKDILIHAKPTTLNEKSVRKLSLSEPSMERPILKSSNHPRAATGSQTDISAAFGWKSESQLSDNAQHNSNYNSSGIKLDRRLVVALSSGSKREIEKRNALILAGKVSSLKGPANTGKKKAVCVEVDPPSSDLDDILREADRYLKVAKQRLVTCQDWAEIRKRKKS